MMAISISAIMKSPILTEIGSPQNPEALSTEYKFTNYCIALQSLKAIFPGIWLGLEQVLDVLWAVAACNC